MVHRGKRSSEKQKIHQERFQKIVLREQSRPRYNVASSFKLKQIRTISSRSKNSTVMKQQRNAIGVCVHCGNSENLNVHHVDGNRGNNLPENLLVLCVNCHRQEHGAID